MSSTSTDRLPIVEEVVATLTSAAGAGYGGAAALRAGMRRATDQFDQHAAAALARSLVDCLCVAPDDLRILETLVILGLAHPGALEAQRISLVNEGRRLAILLEKSGQFERAYCLGELIAERAPAAVVGLSTEDTTAVEQLVRDAELAAARGRTEVAIRCLEKAQKIDPARTDLSRAIRDLRRKKEFKKSGVKRSLRLGVKLALFSAAVTAVLMREVRIWNRWKTLPESSATDLPSMRARVQGIDDLIRKEHVWLLLPKAFIERDVLRHDIELHERPILPVETDNGAGAGTPEPQTGKSYADAEAARSSGLRNAENGHVTEALADLRRALEIAPADWLHRQRVQADIAALDAWHKKNP